MAAINEIRVSIFDNGAGVSIDAEAVVDVKSVTTRTKFALGDLGLTPAQVTSLQNSVNAVRARVTVVTKTEYTIP